MVEAIRERCPGARFVGLGGPDLAAQGVTLLENLDALAVMGFAEVARHLRFFWRLERRLVEQMERGEVDLVLAVDYPGFNMRVARQARKRGIPVVYYIAPQVWAWKEHRAARLAEDADRVAVILPFEASRLEAVGAQVTFVGHPLMERDEVRTTEAELRRALGLPPADLPGDAGIVALLPGSRRQELDRHLDLLAETARRLVAARPGARPVIAAAPGVDLERLRATGLPVTTRTRELLTHARAGVVKSGTSTLEAAVAATPFVCVYRTHPLTWMLARRLVKVPHIALANLVAGEEIVPEVLQGDATPSRLLAEVAPLLEEGEARRQQLAGLARVRERLGGEGASRRTAELVLDVLGERAA